MDEVYFVLTDAIWATRGAIKGGKCFLGLPDSVWDWISRGLARHLPDNAVRVPVGRYTP